jgi:hypothetical protein
MARPSRRQKQTGKNVEREALSIKELTQKRKGAKKAETMLIYRNPNPGSHAREGVDSSGKAAERDSSGKAAERGSSGGHGVPALMEVGTAAT